MNLDNQFAIAIIRKSFHLSIWTIEQFYDVKKYEDLARELRSFIVQVIIC